MDERRRLFERIYSREGAEETPREYRDPSTGRPVRMTPSEWALAEYDRGNGHRRAAKGEARVGAEHDDAGGPPPSDQPQGFASSLDGAPPAGGPGESGSDDRGADAASARRRLSRRALPTLLAAAGFVLGVLITVGVSATIAHLAPSSPVGAESSPTAAARDGGYRPLPGPAIQEFFAKSPGVGDLPDDVTRGFVATSFHVVAGSVTMQESSTIYAAQRLDHEYCLVSVVDGERAAETCASLGGIATHGLTLTKDAVRDIDGRPLAVTVTWQTDGTISWTAMPSAG
ncbi:hypothetical protein HII28_07250 [Planctomonas sp. JC2975]|uniref:hypothetical protein n=1 Tax=Planctomonas sp. JC2975 TaxID=2729626 RepID=UPI00147608F7|nr:hypothetical protein [Planctomonas sp. JC2975]NNC11670.1 hypothetical protein [Planctomonas sp. JC2975]